MARDLYVAEWDTLKLLACDTAGRGRAGLVLRALDGKIEVDESTPRSALYFDEKVMKISRMVYGRQRCPYVMIHEFGHAYHAYYWPVLTALMRPPCARAEAVALLFECELQAVAAEKYLYRPPKGMPFFTYLATSTWQARLKTLRALRQENPEPFDILEQMVDTHRPTQDFHSLVERIVNGGGS